MIQFIVIQSLIDGDYSDPNHPGCSRLISSFNSHSIELYGSDAEGGEGVPCTAENQVKWGPLPGKELQGLDNKDNGVLSVDFSSKGGPANLKGTYNNTAIYWEDGNIWTKIS